ncbi:invasion protein [Opitutaceae bacterium TAV5]|nr:invasion protein [Opitutaceae bacterium TAV5]
MSRSKHNDHSTAPAESDIAIFGSSPGAVTTAVHLARRGLRVFLCHSGGFLGGSVTAGLASLPPEMTAGPVAEIPDIGELLARARRRVAVCEERDTPHPEAFKIVLDEYATTEANLRLRFHTQPVAVALDSRGTSIRAVQLHSKNGFETVIAREFIDASTTGQMEQLVRDKCRSRHRGVGKNGYDRPPLRYCVGRATLGNVYHVAATATLVPSFNSFSVHFNGKEARPGTALSVRQKFRESYRRTSTRLWVPSGSADLTGGCVELEDGGLWTERRLTIRFLAERGSAAAWEFRRHLETALGFLRREVAGFEDVFVVQTASALSHSPIKPWRVSGTMNARPVATGFSPEADGCYRCKRLVPATGSRSETAEALPAKTLQDFRIHETPAIATKPDRASLQSPEVRNLHRLPDDLWWDESTSVLVEGTGLSLLFAPHVEKAVGSLKPETGSRPAASGKADSREKITFSSSRESADSEATGTDDFDVAVIGGGPSGVAAAVAAARHGARVVLVEQSGELGGSGSTGGVTSFAGGSRGGIYEEVLDALHRQGYKFPPNQAFDPEGFRLVLDHLVRAAGVAVRFGCVLCSVETRERIIRALTVFRDGKMERIHAAVVIDCSGDGDVAKAAGVPVFLGREQDRLTQPCSLMYQVAMDTGRRHLNLFWKIPHGRFLINATRVAADGTNAEHLTRAEIEGRRQMWDQMDTLRKHFDYRLVQSGPRIGIRETRRIEGEYTLTMEDVVAGRYFHDHIGKCDYFLDIHNPTGARGTKARRVPSYDIPYRSLVPRCVDNLLAAGRCISMTHEAMSSLRVMPPCFIIGQAAGTAAALAFRAGVPVRELDVRFLQSALISDGMDLSH